MNLTDSSSEKSPQSYTHRYLSTSFQQDKRSNSRLERSFQSPKLRHPTSFHVHYDASLIYQRFIARFRTSWIFLPDDAFYSRDEISY